MKNNMKRVIFAVLIMVIFVQVVYGWNGGIKKIFAADDWEQISKSDIIGTWYSENYDEKDNWACSYKAKFVSKGNKVTVIGYQVEILPQDLSKFVRLSFGDITE